jgi:hypothetical protein
MRAVLALMAALALAARARAVSPSVGAPRFAEAAARLKSSVGSEAKFEFATFNTPEGYNRVRRPYCTKADCSKPLTVYVDTQVNEFFEFNEDDGYVETDVLLAYKWHDPRLAEMRYSGQVEGYDKVWPIWIPDIYIRNQQEPATITNQACYLNSPLSEGDPPGTVVFTQRVHVLIFCDWDPWAYPFDKQLVQIELASMAYNSGDVVFKQWTRAHSFKRLGHNISPLWSLDEEWHTEEIVDTVMSEKDSIYLTTFAISRKPYRGVVQVILPIYLIMIFSYLALFVDHLEFEVRIEVSSIGFLTLMGYTYMVEGVIPPGAEMLWIHWFIALSMFSNFAVVMHLLCFHFFVDGPEKKAQAIMLEKAQELRDAAGQDDDVDKGRISKGSRPMHEADGECVAAEFTGLISAVMPHVKPGSRVVKGETLLKIEADVSSDDDDEDPTAGAGGVQAPLLGKKGGQAAQDDSFVHRTKLVDYDTRMKSYHWFVRTADTSMRWAYMVTYHIVCFALIYWVVHMEWDGADEFTSGEGDAVQLTDAASDAAP